MADPEALPSEALDQLSRIGRADLVIGIPSYENAGTIGHVLRMAAQGAVRYFPGLKTVIMNSDGDSFDGTMQVALGTPVPEGVQVIATSYQGPSGKGSAFRAIFRAAELLGARASVVVDSDLRSITPEWIKLLASPILEQGYDFVAPYYSRHKHDATITNHIAYPLTRALYGWQVRQPIGGDFGYSGALASRYLQKNVWASDVARYGIDIWMTTTALNEGFKVCQACLGAKVHDAKDPALSLGPMFAQVVGTLFSLMETYHRNWRRVEGSQPVPRYGPPLEVEPEAIPVTLPALIAKLQAGIREFGGVWEAILSSPSRAAMERLTAQDPAPFAFPAADWVHIVYDFAAAYHRSSLDRGQVIAALVPLYYGRAAGFAAETREMTTAQAEAVVEAQARLFETMKPYLIARWG
jgi:glycosyltransferase involved in cell wall biosynthesis